MTQALDPTHADTRPPISVCLACHNGERYIAAQLQSVLTQLLPGDEVIVSDDASSDQTVEIVKSFDDSRIRLVLNARPLGIVRNFEQAMRLARHDHLFLCDQDDIWLPQKVDHMVKALATSVMVVSDCQVVDAELKTLHPSFFALRGSRPGIPQNLWRNSYLGCCIAFRRSLLERALPMPSHVPMHDMWLGLVAQTLGTVTFLPEVLSLYRRHGRAASQAALTSSASRWRQLVWRWQLAYALLLRWGWGR